MTGEDPYFYPGTTVLRNRLGSGDGDEVDWVRWNGGGRAANCRGAPAGDFDLGHLRAIHKHLFQDVYAWAGELRTVEIAKGGQPFQFRRFIETGMADVHRRLERADYLRRLTCAEFAEAAGPIMGDVNHVHPFREGNGRAQLQFLEQLAARAGHTLDLARIDPRRWLDASGEPPTMVTMDRCRRRSLAPSLAAAKGGSVNPAEYGVGRLDRVGLTSS